MEETKMEPDWPGIRAFRTGTLLPGRASGRAPGRGSQLWLDADPPSLIVQSRCALLTIHLFDERVTWFSGLSGGGIVFSPARAGPASSTEVGSSAGVGHLVARARRPGQVTSPTGGSSAVRAERLRVRPRKEVNLMASSDPRKGGGAARSGEGRAGVLGAGSQAPTQCGTRWVRGGVQPLETETSGHSRGETTKPTSTNETSGPHGADGEAPRRAHLASHGKHVQHCEEPQANRIAPRAQKGECRAAKAGRQPPTKKDRPAGRAREQSCLTSREARVFRLERAP
eukprot:6476288-Amphidinium_carterae.3